MTKIVTDKIKLSKVVTDLPKNKTEEDVISAALFTALEKEKGSRKCSIYTAKTRILGHVIISGNSTF